MGKGQELYKYAKSIIPGGTQLLSKRPEMFLPDLWPTYYSRAKGCEVWDLDGRHYFDVSYMGIGANTLGYANDDVDAAAKAAIDNSGMCTLNAPEEVYLAEKLLNIHNWAGGVRYAKAGGEGMALAIRIARAYTKKDVVLFCGYHGWHDWYLSANLSDCNALSDQHIPGLEPLGVPSSLAGTNIPFHYNNVNEFLNLFEKHKSNVAAVVMEPIRNDYPENDFLGIVRNATKKHEIVLVFDEITAGFRICLGGSHLVLGVEPDIAVYAKGMSNGYPLSAIIGKKSVMEAAQGTFISSTYHTERIAFAAAIKAIELFHQSKVWETLIEYGKIVKAGWQKISENTGVEIVIGGIDPLSHFSFVCDNPLVHKTYFIQEMLDRGYLASTAFYTSYAHSEQIIKDYLLSCEDVFMNIQKITASNRRIESFLKGPVCHAGFGRLN